MSSLTKTNMKRENVMATTKVEKPVTPKKKIVRKKSITIVKSVPVVERNNQVAKIPDKKILDTYIDREINGKKLFDYFDYGIKYKRNVLIESHTGAGKTMGVTAYAASRGLPLFKLPFSLGFESSQALGKVHLENNSTIWHDGGVTDIMRHGGIIYFDEINTARAGQLAMFHPMLDKNRELILIDHNHEVIKAHDEVLFVATMNPKYAGTNDLNMALRNRFAVQLDLDYDRDIEQALVKSPALLTVVEQIRAQSTEIRTPLSTNMIIEFEEMVAFLGFEQAMVSFVNHFDSRKERGAIQTVLQTHSVDIEDEINNAYNVSDTFDKNDFVKRMVDEDEDMSVLGVEGVDWFYTDENKL